jgi:hypothetical protein
MAERARRHAELARLFGCSVPEVRAMTLREVDAMRDLMEGIAKERARAQAMEEARAQARSGRHR